MPAKDVKAYVKCNKNDAADAEPIYEAVRRPTMRFVRIKSAEQQGQLMQHRTRDVLIRQRTQIINALRAHLAELRRRGPPIQASSISTSPRRGGTLNSYGNGHERCTFSP